MKLVKDWKKIATKAHSMRAVYLGTFVLAAPELLFLFLGYDLINPYVTGWLGLLLLIYGGLGRIIDQGIEE